MGEKKKGEENEGGGGGEGETNGGTWKDEDGRKREKEGLVTQLLSNGRGHLTATGTMQQDLSGFPRQCRTEALLDSQKLHAVLNTWQA